MGSVFIRTKRKQVDVYFFISLQLHEWYFKNIDYQIFSMSFNLVFKKSVMQSTANKMALEINTNISYCSTTRMSIDIDYDVITHESQGGGGCVCVKKR